MTARQRAPLQKAVLAALTAALAAGLVGTLAAAEEPARAPTGTSAAPRLSPSAPGLGERATLTLEHAPSDSLHRPKGLGVALLATPDPSVWTAVPLKVGRVGIALSDSGATDPAAQRGDTLWWTVPSELATASGDSLAPLKAAPTLRPNWIPSILLLAVLLAGPLIWLWRRRRRRPARVIAFPLLAEPPHRVALRRLAEIASTRWLEDGEFDRYYVEATRALREYIAGRYRVPALDWTSDEVADRLRHAAYDRADIGAIGPLLAEADRVKFGAGRPTQHAAQQWMERARAFVEETAVEPVFTTVESVAAAEALSRRAAA